MLFFSFFFFIPNKTVYLAYIQFLVLPFDFTYFVVTLQNNHISFCSLNHRNNDFVVNGQELGPLENTSSQKL